MRESHARRSVRLDMSDRMLQLIHWGDRQEVRSEDQGAQEVSGLITAGTQTRTSRTRQSSITHKSTITDHVVEENHVIGWDKAKVVDREAQRQTRWIKKRFGSGRH